MFSKLKTQLLFGGMLVWGSNKGKKSLFSALFEALDKFYIVFFISLTLVCFPTHITPLFAEEIIPQASEPFKDLVVSTERLKGPNAKVAKPFSPYYSDLSSLRLEFFAGVDSTENQVGFYLGGVVRPMTGHSYVSNVRLRAVYAEGYYSYHSSKKIDDAYVDVQFDGYSEFYEAMIGYEFRLDKVIIKAYAGLTSETNHIDPRDPQNSLEGSEYGAKFLLEGWYEFSSGHWLSSYGSYSTGSDYYVAHSRYGLPLLTDIPYIGAIDVGVETGVFGNKEFDALRLGAFARQKTSIGEFTFSAGISGDYDQPDALYGTFQYYRKLGQF
jgi:hypothetical protein